ncbi:MAG: 5-formyltetrahydrofolate cyclo-ligase [Colwelliaceae bacterium]|nr:5-formyltetrahydrofolate cyclo-ligase [Colwelliaceae bacterium]
MTGKSIKSRNEIRQAVRSKRKGLDEQVQKEEAQYLAKVLSLHPKVIEAKAIAIYLSNDGELNTNSFIDYCWHNNIKTYLPVIHPFSKGNLLFLNYHTKSIMVKNQYGILEPELNVSDVIPLTQIDIIFTPLVAFDNTGARLGMGGGYYDRTLATWFSQKNKAKTPYPIGLAHTCQQVEIIPIEHWDIPLPEIITPHKQFKFY